MITRGGDTKFVRFMNTEFTTEDVYGYQCRRFQCIPPMHIMPISAIVKYHFPKNMYPSLVIFTCHRWPLSILPRRPNDRGAIVGLGIHVAQLKPAAERVFGVAYS